MYAIASPVLAQNPTAASDFFEQGREQFEREIEALNHSISRRAERDTLDHELPLLEIRLNSQPVEPSVTHQENAEELPSEPVPNVEEPKPNL